VNKSEYVPTNDDGCTGEQMISNLLHDLLTEQSATDQQQAILSRLDRAPVAGGDVTNDGMNDANAMFTADEHQAATALALREHASGSYVIPPAVDRRVHLNIDEPDLSVWIRRGAVLIAALAASVIGVMFVPWNHVSKISNENETAGLEEFDSGSVHKTAINDANAPSTTTSEGPMIDVAPPNLNGSNVVANDKRMEATNSPGDSIASLAEPDIKNQKDRNRTTASRGEMTDNDVVGIIDSQLSHMWTRVGLQSEQPIEMDRWLDRVATTLIGRLPTAAEKEVYRTDKNKDKNERYVDRMIGADEFSRHWSKIMASYYVGHSIDRDEEKRITSEQAFVSWVAKSISDKVFVGSMVREMMLGPSGSPAKEPTLEDAIRTDPASYVVGEWLASARSESHAIDDARAGGTVSYSKEPFASASRQWMRLSGHGAVVCAQCHDAKFGSDYETGELKANPFSDMNGYLAETLSNDGQDSFWSIAANLRPFAIQEVSEGNRGLKISQPKELFIEDHEGRMKIVRSALPTSPKVGISLQELGDWMASSLGPRSTEVEHIWHEVFQQPLVPRFGLTEDEGSKERMELLGLLANQVQLGQRDIGSMVRWFVLSKAFRIDHPAMDTPWYLKATETQLVDTQKRFKMFAASSVGSSVSELSQGGRSQNPIAIWLDTHSRTTSTSNALAQPSVNPKGSNDGSNKASKLVYSQQQIRYLIENAKPYSNVTKFAQRLSQSSIDWSKKIDHAYLATNARFPSEFEREQSKRLLEALNGNAAAALLMIVNANESGSR
jgi:hypothetical protein